MYLLMYLFIFHSTGYTDSDADCESGKPYQQKSKPEKKKVIQKDVSLPLQTATNVTISHGYMMCIAS